MTQDKEKPTVEETSASSVAQIITNGDHASNDIAEQRSSLDGGQEQKRSSRSAKTGLTGHEIGLTGPSGNFGNSPKTMTRKKPSFEELLRKYQKIAEEKQINWLEGNQTRNYASSRTKKNQQHWRSSHWYSLFIPSMHVPWTTYSGISDSSPWSYYDPWLVYYDYQHPPHALPRSHDLYDRPPWP